MVEVERRKTTRSENLNELFNLFRVFAEQQKSLSEQLQHHMKSEEAEAKATTAAIMEIRDKVNDIGQVVHAFPHIDGKPDYRGHRGDHETRMEEAYDSKKLRERIKGAVVEQLTKGIVILVVVIVGLGVKDYLIQMVKG